MKRTVFSFILAFSLLLPPLLSGTENMLPSGFKQWIPAHGAEQLSKAGHAEDDVLQIKHPNEKAPEQSWTSPEIPVEPGSILRLSAWMKCNCVALDGMKQRSDPTYNASLSVQFRNKAGEKIETEKPVLSVCHSVRRTWKYLSDPVIVPKNAASVQIRFHFRRHALGLAWASDVRLEKTDGTNLIRTAVPATERKPLLSGPDATGLLPFFPDSGKFSQIFEPGQEISFKIRYRSIQKNLKPELPAGAILQYTVRDIDGRQIEQGSVPLAGNAKDIFRLKVPENILPGVYHEIHAEIFTGEKLWADDTISFGIIPSRPCDPNSEPEIFELPGMDELAIRMGVRRRYLIGGNPSDNKLKRAAAMKKKYGVKFYTNGLIVTTSWMMKDAPERSNSFFKKDEATFRADLHTQLLRYKGIIDGVGVMGEMLPPQKNEKDGEKQAEDQVEVMRILKEEINKVDPSMQAAAGGYFYPEFDLLWKKGLAKYADLIMLHRFSDPAITASELKKNLEDMKQRGGKVPEIWVDEAYCFGDAENQAPQQYAAYLANGVKIGDWHVYNFKYRDYWKEKALSIFYPVRSNVTLPEPALFSYNVMIGKLSGLKFLYDVPSLKQNGITCYVFRKKATGRLLITVWTNSDVSTRVLRIQTKADASICDLRGKEIRLSPDAGFIEIGLTPRLQYVELEDPEPFFSCKKESSFPERLTFTHGKNTTVSAGLFTEFAKDNAVSMILPAGWQCKKNGTQQFSVTPEPTVPVNRECFGEIVLSGKNGNPCAAYPVRLKIVPPVQVEIEPQFAPKGNQLRVKIKNSGNAGNASLKLTHSFTKGHHPETIRKDLILAGNGAETILDFPVWANGQPDEYPVTLALSDSAGNPVQTMQKLLSFCSIPHAKGPHSFTGGAHEAFWAGVPILNMDSELWLDGHELCTVGDVFAVPEQNDGTWKGKDDFSVRLQQCWDEKNYYFRAAVLDVMHINDFKDMMIWSGDAVQFRIANASNNGAFSAFCIALNQEKQPQVWRYRGNEFNKTGPAGKVSCKISRDEKTKQTIYELVFPKSEIEPVSLQTGNQLKASFVFLNRVNRNGKNPMAMRFGYGIYGGGGSGDAILHLIRK